MGAGMGERENDTRGYGSHLPKQSPNPTPTFTCPTPLRTFTLGSHAIYRSRPPTPPHLLLRAARHIRQRRLGTGSVVWIGESSGQNVGMSCDVGMWGGVPERPAAQARAQNHRDPLGPRRRTNVGLLREPVQRAGVSVSRRDPNAYPATV
jgi:hypothetical protein